jgi:hypothetical protein
MKRRSGGMFGALSSLTVAQRLAEQRGFSVVDIANELRWPDARVRAILGLEDAGPKLRLLPKVALRRACLGNLWRGRD